MSEQLIAAAKAPLNGFNNKDWDSVRAGMTSNFKYDEVPTHRKVEGADNVLEVWRGWADAFPDSAATFHSAYVADDHVFIELSWRGTHNGALQTPDGPVPATGKSIDIRACVIARIENGKVAAQTHYFDMATMMTQLGLAS